MKKTAGNILALFLSIMFCFIAAEVLVRLIAPQSLYGSWKLESKAGGYWINKESGDALQQFRGRSVRYNFGMHHLRVGSTRPAAAALNNILVLGESFTFGSLLNWDDTYVAKIQRSADNTFGLNKVQFLNASVTGWGLADYVAFYEDYGPEINNNTVLVFFNTDDVGRSARSRLFTLDESLGTLQRQKHVAVSGRRLKSIVNAIPFYEFMIEHSHVLTLVRNAATMPIISGPPPIELAKQWESECVITRTLPDPASVNYSTRLAMALFERMSRLAHQRHHRLIVLTTGWHKFGHPHPDEPTAAFMSVAERFFKERGIQFVDLSDMVYRRAGGTLAKLVIPGDCHPNEAGASLITDAAWEVLSKTLP